MNRRLVLGPLAIGLALGVASTAHADCKMQLLASIPISFVNERPMVEATINGKPALLRFSLSSEIWIWGSALKDYDLKLDYPVVNRRGIGEISATLVHEFSVSGSTQTNAHYDVAPNMKKDGEAGLFGSELFNDDNDVELDFAHDAVRVFKSDSCKGDEVVYWGGAYSVADQNRAGQLSLKLSGKTVNGEVAPQNEVTFVLTDEALRSGVSLRRAGSLPVGMLGNTMTRPIDISIGMFSEIVIGDEIIKNVPLAVGNVLPMSHTWGGPDVLLGADFVKAHRIYHSAAQRKMYFSYGGGPAFQDIYARLSVQRPVTLAPAPKP